jgi:SnoaL-like domain
VLDQMSGTCHAMDDVESVRTLGLLRTSTSAEGTVEGGREALTGARAGADAVVEAVAQRDFGCLAAALHDDVHLRALLPGGFKEWHGRAGVNAAFTGWFDGFDEYELVHAEVCEVGARLHLSWRLRVRATKAAYRSLVVEQQVYADVDADNRISRLSLLCSGFSRERARG